MGSKDPLRILAQVALAVALRRLERLRIVQEEAVVKHQSQDEVEHKTHVDHKLEELPVNDHEELPAREVMPKGRALLGDVSASPGQRQSTLRSAKPARPSNPAKDMAAAAKGTTNGVQNPKPEPNPSSMTHVSNHSQPFVLFELPFRGLSDVKSYKIM